jgi:hypothetical protein
MGGRQEVARSVIVLVPMMMTASAAGTMLVVVMIVGMSVVVMLMPMRMIMVLMAVVMIVTVMMVVRAHMGAALRLEGTLHGRHRAALPAREFGEDGIVLDVESITRDLGKAVVAAEVPGETDEAKRVFRLHFQKALGQGFHLHETAILQAQRISVVDGGFHVEIEDDFGSRLALERCLTAVARLMVERHRIDDTVGLHGGLADDSGNAGHVFVS